MRVFDIERTCVADEFTQFNMPLKCLAYSPNCDLLVTCCQDGSVSCHSALRQHIPVKMMHLEYPPETVHVAFEKLLDGHEEGTSLDFGVMGEHGNSVNVYDSSTYKVTHSISAGGNIVSQFAFANNNRDLMMATIDCKVRFYSLSKFEGIFLREISTVHRGAICSSAVSQNSGFLLTGG